MIPVSSLQNKQVMIPRGANQARPFVELVERLGGIPVEIPLLAFRHVALSDELLRKLKQIHTYDWIIFTSHVTVETLLSMVEGLPSMLRVAVIGEKTRQSLELSNIRVEFTPEEFVAEGFVREFLPYVKKGMRVLIPKGNLAREYIATSLRSHGAIVDELIVYETYMPEASRSKLAQMLTAGKLDILPFTSPSTIDHFMATVKDYHLEARIGNCIVACIGPESKKKAEQYGLIVQAYPKKYTVAEMMNSVIEYLNNENQQ